MIRGAVLALALALAAGAAAQEVRAPGELLSSYRDTSDPAVRDLPVRCKEGDLERAAGRTLGEVFGDAWPAVPAATARAPAGVERMGRFDWPPGLDVDRAFVVAAVLVDAQGAPQRAEVLCASAPGFDAAVKRAALRGAYRPARFDGAAAPGVAMTVWRLAVPSRGR